MTELFRRFPHTDLPVFFRPAEDGLYNLYAPGYIALADKQHFEILCEQFPCDMVSLRLEQAAKRALRLSANSGYKPLCLTIYSSLKCNLHCTYCFSAGLSAPDTTETFIYSNAAEVISNCLNAGKPFTIVFQGGGEPTFDKRLPKLLQTLRRMAELAGLDSFAYLTTNGVMSEEDARKYALLFDEISISMDGQPQTHNSQRFQSYEITERTARIFKTLRGSLKVRMTVRREHIAGLSDSVVWLCENFKPNEIRVEPEFSRFLSEDAMSFCDFLIKARKIANTNHCKLIYCGTRLNDIHGRYCQIFRNVLQLIPGDGHSVCFLEGSAEHAAQKGLLMTANRISELNQVLKNDNTECFNCFNQYHCTRGCPDICPITGQNDVSSFRCLLNREFAEREITRLTENYRIKRIKSDSIAGISLYN